MAGCCIPKWTVVGCSFWGRDFWDGDFWGRFFNYGLLWPDLIGFSLVGRGWTEVDGGRKQVRRTASCTARAFAEWADAQPSVRAAAAVVRVPMVFQGSVAVGYLAPPPCGRSLSSPKPPVLSRFRTISHTV